MVQEQTSDASEGIHRSSLPIDALRQDFDRSLDRGPVVLEAPTGSGKSTRLPLWCAAKGSVLVVEPRRLACLSLARYLARTEHIVLGEEIGYAIRFDTAYSKSSRIVFATPGIALRWYAANGLRSFETVVLDEFHERRWDTDLLAAMLRGSHSRLVLTSATVEGTRLAGYLGGVRLQAKSRLHPVETAYTDREELPRSKGLEQRVAASVRSLLRDMESGDVLVFLPGRGEIRAVQSRLKEQQTGAEIIPLHASVDAATQDRALTPHRAPRVILATNVAETSVTLPGVKAVVDSGLERRTHHRNGRTVLGLCSISQAAAEQRAGRAGRLGPGRCIRLWGRAAKLEPYTPPEVVREDPAELMLAAAACGHPVRRLSFPDPIPEHGLARAGARLQAIGALDAEGRITAHGERLFQLPLDSQLAHLIAAMTDERTRLAMVHLAGALSAKGPILGRSQPEAAWEKLREWAPEPCDACTLIRLVQNDPPQKVALNRGNLAEARKIAAQIAAEMGLDAAPPLPSPPREELARCIMQAAPELVYVRRSKRRWAMGNEQEEVEVGSGTRLPEDREAAIVLDTHSVPGKGTTRTVTIATCLMPVALAEMSEQGLGRVFLEEPSWDGKTVTAQQKRSFAGRIIETRTQALEGADLCRAAAELVERGELWPELGESLQSDVEAWNLYVRLGFEHGEPVELREWLRERLLGLGVEVSSDLHLLEPGDLAFEGVPQWERERFDRAYPRRLQLENLDLEVAYEPSRKRITLVKIGGIRRSPPSRWELPAWGRNWWIRFRDGSRVVPLD